MYLKLLYQNNPVNESKISKKENDMKKRNIILSLSLIIAAALQAQHSDQYLHFNVGGGIHGLSYDSPNAIQKSKAGFTMNAAYSYFFSSNWGIQTGIGLQSFGASSVLNLSTEMADIDSDGDSYYLNTHYRNWQENQRALLLSIPLSVQYKLPFNDKLGLLASLGAKIALPVSSKFQTGGGEIQTTGKYPQWDLELTDIPSEGFTTTTQNFTGKMPLKSVFTGTVDAGVLYNLSRKIELYLGAYANYGLNNAITPDTKSIYQKDGVYNGLFTSEQLKAVKPFALGIKVGISWKIKESY